MNLFKPSFLPRGAMLAGAVSAVIVCPSVCHNSSRSSTKMAKPSITQTTPLS